jgi:allophanate hydrolase subunit 1
MRPVGDHAALLELPDNASVHATARLARDRYRDQLVDVVPGHETLLLVWRPGSVVSDFSELALERASSERSDDNALRPPAVVIPMRYDGVDLDAITRALDMSPEAVVELHTGVDYTVAFVGFSPGFPYLLADEPSG